MKTILSLSFFIYLTFFILLFSNQFDLTNWIDWFILFISSSIFLSLIYSIFEFINISSFLTNAKKEKKDIVFIVFPRKVITHCFDNIATKKKYKFLCYVERVTYNYSDFKNKTYFSLDFINE